ncbi:hypothetical protein CK203_044220 [Vitis vinifera]|uniref:Uncharacterized protein n=1 Tax=Vitis vinifera TaxID=29760 RepID=A0A438GVC8_VITVI|nr:hypothetical protein CK203_044220 [Vitis vinifera]
MRQMRVSDGSVVLDDFEGMPVASLPAKFRMPDIERYTALPNDGSLPWSLHDAEHFGSLVMALYDVEDGISRGLWTDSSPSDIKGKKPFVGPRPTDGIERPPVSYTATGQPCYAAQFTPRPAPSYPRPRAQQTSAPFALRT